MQRRQLGKILDVGQNCGIDAGRLCKAGAAMHNTMRNSVWRALQLRKKVRQDLRLDRIVAGMLLTCDALRRGGLRNLVGCQFHRRAAAIES